MNEQTHTFVSRHGTLILKPDGVTIKRTWSQALQSGRLVNRVETIPYESLKLVKHQRINDKASYLQLTTKPGTPKSTPFNRHARLRFEAGQTHHFRQAQRLIEERLSQLEDAAQHPQPENTTSEPPNQASQYAPQNMTFRKP